MSRLAVLGRMWAGLAETALRFPLPICAALVYCATAIADRHGWFSESIDDVTPPRLLTLAVLCFFWTLSVRLFAESRGLGMGRQLALAAAGVGLLALKIFADQPALHSGNVVMLSLGPAMVLLAMSAPFLSREAESESFWDFNRSAWLSAGLALLAALILALGLTFALWAIEELFNWDISWRISRDVTTIALAMFCPWLALARLPRRFDAPEGAHCPKALSVLICFVLVPLALGNAMIVYAYIARILVLWELPQGQVAAIVCGYAAFGIATYLAAWPLRTVGPVHVRLFHHYFFHGLLLPVILLAAAIEGRVSAYGLTEPRYMLVLVAFWMAALILVFFWKRDVRLQVVPAALAVLMVTVSFGPWGAADVSLRSQTGRLATILLESGVLVDGRIQPSSVKEAVNYIEREEVASIVRYLRKTGRLEVLSGWFEAGALPSDADVGDVLNAIVPDAVWDLQRRTESINYAADEVVSVEGFDYLVTLESADYQISVARDTRLPDGTTLVWQWLPDREHFLLQIGEGDETAIELGSLIDGLRDRYGVGWTDKVAEDDLILDDRIGSYEARLLIRRLRGSIDASDGMSLDKFEFNLLLRQTDVTGSHSDSPD